jgi:AcrR family transcriptional regulator
VSSSAIDSEFENLISREIGEPRPAAPLGLSPARRGRPRSEAVEASIVEAMLRLMARGSSLASLTVEAIANEAGVGKATIYRRWPDKEALLLHLLVQLEAKAEPVCEHPTLRETLVAALEGIRLNAVNRRSGTNLALIGAEIRAIPDLYVKYHEAVIAPRRAALRELLQAAQRRGELRDDLDPGLLCELIVGPMLSRAVLHPDASLDDPELSAAMVDAVLEGIAARPGHGGSAHSQDTHTDHAGT